MPNYLAPWVLDEVEIQVDILQARHRVVSNFEGYLQKHFLTVCTAVINEGKMKNGKSGKTTSQQTLVWVNTQLTDQHILDFTEQERSESEILFGLLALVGSGYELAIKHDPSAGCWRAYLFNKLPDNAVHFGLSCFASTPADTINLLLFKFYVVLNGEWPEDNPEIVKPKFG